MGHEHTHATTAPARKRGEPSADAPAPVAPVPLPSRPAPVIRRAVDLTKVQPLVSRTSAAPVVLAGKTVHLRRTADGWEVSMDGTATWRAPSAAGLKKLADDGDWAGKIVVLGKDGDETRDVVDMSTNDKPLAVSTGDAAFNVSELPRDTAGAATALDAAGGYEAPVLAKSAKAKKNVKDNNGAAPGGAPGDRHSVVHHTANKDGSGAHLTVENAHLELMLALQESGTTAGMDKHVEQKPGINELLGERGANEIDNLNFFPNEAAGKKGKGGAAKEEPASVSLQDYLALITKALGALPDVPPVYAAKIMQAAGKLASVTKLDLGQLFLRQGNGDERHLVRALVIMKTKNLADLPLPKACLDVFTKYATNVPDLPLTEPVGPATEWVRKGAQSADGKTHWNTLETKYVAKYFPDCAAAVKAYAKPA